MTDQEKQDKMMIKVEDIKHRRYDALNRAPKISEWKLSSVNNKWQMTRVYQQSIEIRPLTILERIKYLKFKNTGTDDTNWSGESYSENDPRIKEKK